MAWGKAKQWGRRPTHERGPVVWSDKTGMKPAPFAQQLPRYGETKSIPDEYVALLEGPGSLWTTLVPLRPDARGGTYPPLVYHCYPDVAPVKVRSLLIYAGIERVEERERNGRIVSVPRYTFIAGEGRYIINDFSYIAPV